MTDNSGVILEKRGQAFWITINRPDKRNALNADVIAGLAKGYRDAHEDKDVRVIVLTGAGDKAFCAGADLQNSGAAFSMDYSRPNVDYADLLRLSQNSTKPAIARVGGVCMAGGMGLLCMTDMAVAADNVIFGLPEVKVGVFPMQVMSLLQSIAPPRLINEWALPGEPFDAILINAGVTHPRREWIDALGERGRMVLPLTARCPEWARLSAKDCSCWSSEAPIRRR